MLLGAALLPGCLTGGDDEPPVLVVDLHWDQNGDPDKVDEGSCDSAQVSYLTWKLKDSSGGVVYQSQSEDDAKSDVEPCWDQIPFEKLPPDDYELDVTGYDNDDNASWSSRCIGLGIERFDQHYVCVVQKDDSDAADTAATDTATPGK